MKNYVWLACGMLAFSGCQEASMKTSSTAGEKKTTVKTTSTTETHAKEAKSDGSKTTEKGDAAPDNSAVNERDRSGTTKTPIDQNEDKDSIKTTADIRKQVVAQSDFSIAAKNVKIITADGKVTLRGPVKTQSERDTIEKIARDVAGKENVDSQLEVTP
jgi:hyperosmotically inducible protein